MLKHRLIRYGARLSVVVVILLMLLAACTSAATPTTPSTPTHTPSPTPTQSPTPQPTGITAASVQAYASPVVESMLVSLDNNDYAGFSKDLDQAARSAITATVFSQLYDQIKSAIGNYESAIFFGFSVQGANTTVVYIAQYSGEPAGVTVTAVFKTENSTRYVQGFALDSPKLRGQSIDVIEIMDYADPATENVLLSLNDDNYEAFSSDFDQTMKSSFDENSFNQLYNTIKARAGYYVSKQFENVTVQNNVTTVRYLAQYTEEPSGVWVIISFDSNREIAGLFFNSPKINGQ